MAWNTLNYECGHTTREQLYGKMEARERTVEHAATRLCPDCFRAKVDAERATQNAAAAAANIGLPALVGSAKQIAWAETLRAAAMPALKTLDDRLSAAPANADQAAVAVARAIVQATMARTSAAEWIDTRTVVYDARWIQAATAKAQGRA